MGTGKDCSPQMEWSHWGTQRVLRVISQPLPWSPLQQHRHKPVKGKEWTNSNFLGGLLYQPPQCTCCTSSSFSLLCTDADIWPHIRTQEKPLLLLYGSRLLLGHGGLHPATQGTKYKHHLKQCFESVLTTSCSEKWIYTVIHYTRVQVCVCVLS